ncbi:MAG: hypothetical protein AAF231_03295 [Pseudomonadota bacterium]
MARFLVILFLTGTMALAETDAKIEPVEDVATADRACDTCQARQNGKRALREYLAQKRAEEEAETKDDD